MCGCLLRSCQLHSQHWEEPGASCSHMFWEVWWQIPGWHEPQVCQHDSNLVSLHFSFTYQVQILQHLDQGSVHVLLGEDASRVDLQEVVQHDFMCCNVLMADAPLEVHTAVGDHVVASLEVLEHDGCCATFQSSHHSLCLYWWWGSPHVLSHASWNMWLLGGGGLGPKPLSCSGPELFWARAATTHAKYSER